MRYRHERIKYLLAATPRYDVASIQKLQRDQLSVATLWLLPFLNHTLMQLPLHPPAGAAPRAMGRL